MNKQEIKGDLNLEISLTKNKKYKTEKCRILSYNKATKELDIDFHGYGIRIKNADKKIYDIFNSLVGVDLYEC